MPSSSLCGQVWFSSPPAVWKCVLPAPKKTWLKTVKNDLALSLGDAYGTWERHFMQIVRDLG